MHRRQRRMKTVRQIGNHVILMGMKQQQNKQLTLMSRPENRHQRRSITTHNPKISTVYTKRQRALWHGPHNAEKSCGIPSMASEQLTLLAESLAVIEIGLR